MKIQHTPAPYPSTIISLSPAEQFRYRGTLIQSITLDPATLTLTLAGVKEELFTTKKNLRTYTVPRDAQHLLPQHLLPHLAAAAAAAARTHLAAPGPAPTPAQADSISRSAQRTAPAPRLTPQPQHLAARAHTPAPRTPGAHRA